MDAMHTAGPFLPSGTLVLPHLIIEGLAAQRVRYSSVYDIGPLRALLPDLLEIADFVKLGAALLHLAHVQSATAAPPLPRAPALPPPTHHLGCASTTACFVELCSQRSLRRSAPQRLRSPPQSAAAHAALCSLDLTCSEFRSGPVKDCLAPR